MIDRMRVSDFRSAVTQNFSRLHRDGDDGSNDCRGYSKRRECRAGLKHANGNLANSCQGKHGCERLQMQLPATVLGGIQDSAPILSR
jgi:hypothetical protein